jgi:ribosome biogenesis GTPase
MAKRRNKASKGGRSASASRKRSAGRVEEALPALVSLEHVPAFSDLRPSPAQLAAFERTAARVGEEGLGDPAELVLGCVVRLDRGFPAIVCEDALFRAEYQARLSKEELGVAVGDWVVVRRPAGHDRPVIEEVLPRESDIARWRGGSRGERQTLAANVDVVLVAQALSKRPLSCARIVRSAVIALDCGARVAVVLTKVDRCLDADRLADNLSRLRTALGEDIPVVVTAAGADPAFHSDATSMAATARFIRDAGADFGDDAVRALVPAGTVGIVLGESGAGKSTLLNALLGQDVLATGAVRDSDDAGRHTTVARRMVALPGAGVIVDEPGLRSLPVVGHERGLAKLFPQIASSARGCRFRDCTHTNEPGCAVLEALEQGAFPPERLDAYRDLAAEMRASAESLDPDVVL